MIEQETKAKLAFKLMRDLISSGEWKEGEKYSAIEVAKKINIGRTTLNDAIKLLEKKGFVYTLPNVGFVIKSYNMKNLQEDLDIRLALEKLAIKYIVTKNSNRDLSHLVSIIRLIEASLAVNEYDGAIAGRENLYGELFKLADSSYLESILDDTWDRQRWLSVKLKDHNLFAFCQVIDLDKQLLEAINLLDYRKSLKVLTMQKKFIEQALEDVLK